MYSLKEIIKMNNNKVSNDISFPECYKTCKLARYFGVSECDSICPCKFNKKENNI